MNRYADGEDTDVKVSVSIITYNHEKFVAQAIESILMQEVDFEYEIIIGEDDSSDRTREIVQTYKEKHPQKIRLFLNDRSNVIYIDGRATGRWNWINNLNHAQGQYIALLEGDDYWTSSYKLQKQVDYLDSHPECSMCFHSTRVISEDGSSPYTRLPPGRKKIYGLRDLLQQSFVASSSVVFRNGLFDEFPAWYYQVPMGDRPLYVLIAEYGKMGYIDEVMSTYRRHSGGYWSSRESTVRIKDTIQMLRMLNTHLDYNYDRVIRASIYFSFCKIAMERGERWNAFVNLLKCLLSYPFHHQVVSSWVLPKIILKLTAPSFYDRLKAWK